MGHAIGEIIAFGVGVTLSPLAIIAVVLMLSVPSGRLTASAFLAAWVLALAVVGTLVVLIADGVDATDNGAPADWVGILQIVVAVLLVVVAARQWSGRPGGGEEPQLPGWMQQLDGITPRRAAGLALLFVAAKPKNLLLTVGAGVAIAETGASNGAQFAALAVFVLLGTLGPGAPVAIHVFMPRRGPGILADLRHWLVRENTTIIAVLCLLIAAKLIGDAVTALAG